MDRKPIFAAQNLPAFQCLRSQAIIAVLNPIYENHYLYVPCRYRLRVEWSRVAWRQDMEINTRALIRK